MPPPHYSLHVPVKRLVSIDTLGQLLKSPDLFFWCGGHMKTEGEGDDAVLWEFLDKPWPFCLCFTKICPFPWGKWGILGAAVYYLPSSTSVEAPTGRLWLLLHICPGGWMALIGKNPWPCRRPDSWVAVIGMAVGRPIFHLWSAMIDLIRPG